MSEPSIEVLQPAPADLLSRVDVHDLVVEFYREVIFDDVLDPVFSEVAEVDWALHIPKLVDYWCRILLGEDCYAGPVMAAHRSVHGLESIRREHCDHWYALWARSVDSRWAGPTAERAKSHPGSLMAGMAKHIFGFEWDPPAG